MSRKDALRWAPPGNSLFYLNSLLSLQLREPGLQQLWETQPHSAKSSGKLRGRPCGRARCLPATPSSFKTS